MRSSKRCERTGKVAYATHLDAQVALGVTHGRSAKYPHRQELRCYKCEFCGDWHLTSQPSKVASAG